ncbi:uncharacterized protein N7483_006304 [Penicillium malachiteum]|uniref:uncharacterized protein n=1 Tax=Penicillium malachiteum TaxID=1324776 RepID=UPI00254812B3|nr:uncharacterized protein N7483_006304 [Penicillium malachiteum]KAJ5731796.1 hypothetical protein N7483_006304 [Penicillium malachiteum]
MSPFRQFLSSLGLYLQYKLPPTPATLESRSRPESLGDDNSNQDRTYYTGHGRFAGQVAAAIDERAGFVSPCTPYQVPLMDAPLFENLDLSVRCSTFPISTELPSQTCADQLVEVYWEYVDPAEPILDRQQFLKYYDSLYSNSSLPLCIEPSIQLSILNLVFALAVQRQEYIALAKRSEEGNNYFRRGWDLFPAESILWDAGSVEQVQCIMLMNRYLHCAGNQQKTWMTAGLAMRIAQTICCHLPESSSAKGMGDDARLKRKVWASCISLDRCVSWSLGRTSVLALIPSPHLRNACELEDRQTETCRWYSELHEIGNRIQLAQIQTRSTLAARSVMPPLHQQEEYHTAVVHLDNCLNEWEANLPSKLQLGNLKFQEDRIPRMTRYLLHIRFLHFRLYLYRPILARFYSMKSNSQSNSIKNPSLSERLLKEGARMCVEAAQSVTSLVVETLDLGPSIGILPWWTRIYYLHIAGVIFLAAMVESDLFTCSVRRSWQNVMETLYAHIHLSTYVQQCITTFEALYMKASHANSLHTLDESVKLTSDWGFSSEDIFHDINFDFDEFLFRTDEVNLGALG